MILGRSGGRFLNGKGGRTGARARAFRSRRAVSDVVATILLLGLTVTLFASIFAFVTTFPSPPAQNSNQFQASLTIGPNASSPGNFEVTSINIIHLAGPAVVPLAIIYLKSAVNPKGPEFANPYSLAAGGLPVGKAWNLGQTWILGTNFTGGQHPAVPDNITVYIVTSTTLLFSVVLPGQVISPPPTFLSAETIPSTPVVGGAFTISAVVTGSISSATVVLSGLPGSFSALPVAMTAGAGGLWTYYVATGLTTASGTYYVFVTATNVAGKTGTVSVPVSITTYSTLIASAFTVTASGAQTKCTAGYTVALNGCKGGDYIYTIAIPFSTVTFGSVIFEVLTSTGTAYSPAGKPTFAIVNISTHLNRASYTGTVAAAPFVMTGLTPFTYVGPITSTSLLSATFYDIVIDTAVATTAWAGLGLTFVVIGQGAYYGTTAPVALP